MNNPTSRKLKPSSAIAGIATTSLVRTSLFPPFSVSISSPPFHIYLTGEAIEPKFEAESELGSLCCREHSMTLFVRDRIGEGHRRGPHHACQIQPDSIRGTSTSVSKTPTATVFEQKPSRPFVVWLKYALSFCLKQLQLHMKPGISPDSKIRDARSLCDKRVI